MEKWMEPDEAAMLAMTHEQRRQHAADAELGRNIRRLVEVNGTLEIDNISTPFGVQSGMFGQFSADTLDESVRTLRAAMEAK